MPLTDTDRQILALERLWFRHSGAKDQRIRDDLGLSATAYYQRLSKLIDTEAALAHDPVTVHRLQRLRAQRQRSRSTRRAA